jgi:hypothetical protein
LRAALPSGRRRSEPCSVASEVPLPLLPSSSSSP